MTQPYNITPMLEKNTISGLMIGANVVADGMIGLGIIVLVYIISFVGFKNYETSRAFAGSSFLAAFVAILLRVMTMISDKVMFGTFIIAGLSIVFLSWEN